MPVGLRRALLLLVSIVVALGVAELVLRAVGYGRITPEMNFGANTRGALERGGFEPDARLFWTLPAAVTPEDRAVQAVHPGRPVPPKNGRLRLIVLGDSCSRIAIGGLPYSADLARLLGPAWDVLNAAVPGYTTFQGLTWLRTQLLALQPDLVVVYFGWNDHWRSTGVTDAEYARWHATAPLRLLALVRGAPSPSPVRVPLDQYVANLRAMVDAIGADGAQTILVVAPSAISPEAVRHLEQTRYILPGENPTALHERYRQAVRTYRGQPGVAVLAADRLFQELDGERPLLMRDGIHLTEPGHAALAAALATLISSGAGADGTVPPAMLEAARAAVAAVPAEAVR